jgi:hypothetical protein
MFSALLRSGDEEAVLRGDDDEILHADERDMLAGLGEDDVVGRVLLRERAVVLIAIVIGLEVTSTLVQLPTSSQSKVARC